MDLHRLRVVEFDSLVSEKEDDKKNIAELEESKQEDCKTLSSDDNDIETNQLENDKIYLRDNASPPESSKISSFIKYKSNSDIFNISTKDKLKKSDLKIHSTLADIKKSFQNNVQNQKKRTLNLFTKKARNKTDTKEKKAVRKKNEEVNFLFARETPSFIKHSRKQAKNEITIENDSKVINDVFGFQENRSVDPRLYQTSCNYLNVDKMSIKKIKKGFSRKPKPKPKPAPVRNCFCKHHAMRVLASAGSSKKDERYSIYYNLNTHSCPRRTRLKRNNDSFYQEVWAKEQPLFMAKDKNIEVSPSSLATIAKSYCNASVGPSQIELTSRSQRPPSGTHRKDSHPRRNKPYPQHSTPSVSTESNGPEQYQPQIITSRRKRTNAKKIFSVINYQRNKLFSGFFQRVNAFHVKTNAPGKKCIQYAFFGLLIVVWSPCLLAVILVWAVMCPMKLTKMLNTNKTKSLFPVLSSFVNKFRKKSPRSDYECFGDYSYPQKQNYRTSVANWYARAAHTVVNSYNALLSMIKIRNKPPTCARSSFLTSTHPNPKKRYTLFYADNRGWMMKSARRSNARQFPGTQVVQAMRCEFRPKFWRKASPKCPKVCVCPRGVSRRGGKKVKSVSTEIGQMKVRSPQKLCCECPLSGVKKGKTASKQKARMKMGSQKPTCECPVSCECLAHGKTSCECLARGKLSYDSPAIGIIPCVCPARGKISPESPARGKISAKSPRGKIPCLCLARGKPSCECLARGKTSCECLARGKISHEISTIGKIPCLCLAHGKTSCECQERGKLPREITTLGEIPCLCLAHGKTSCECQARGKISHASPTSMKTPCECPAHGNFSCECLAGGLTSCECLARGKIIETRQVIPITCTCPTRGTISCDCPAHGITSCKCPAGGTISCKCPAGGMVSCECLMQGAKGDTLRVKGETVFCKCPVRGAKGEIVSCKCPASGTVSCKCPVRGAKGEKVGVKGETVICKCPVRGAKGEIVSCQCPAAGTVSCKCPMRGAKGEAVGVKGETASCKCPVVGSVLCKCPAGGKISCKCPIQGAKGETVSCECPMHGAKNVQKNVPKNVQKNVQKKAQKNVQKKVQKKVKKNVQKNIGKSSAAGDASPIPKKTVSKCICKDVITKGSVQCMCSISSKSSKSAKSSKSSTKNIPQRKVNILPNYFYSTSGNVFNPTIYQIAQTKQNNLYSNNISEISHNDFAKYRLNQRKNGTLPFGVVVDCGTKHPFIRNKETYGTHSFGLAGKTLNISSKFTPSYSKKYLQGQSSTRPSTKYEPSVKSKKSLTIHRTGVTEITKTVPNFSQSRTNRSRGHSTKCEIALNCPCDRKNNNTDKQILGDSSQESVRTSNKSILARLSQAVLTKQVGTNTYKINVADKTQSVSKQTLSQNIRLVKRQGKALQKQHVPLDCIKKFHCPCKNELNIGTETARPKQIASNKKAVDCTCSTEKTSSTAAKNLPSKQPVTKCACNEPSKKKEKPHPEQSLPDKKAIDVGGLIKTQPNTGKGSAIQTALNCPCKYERSIGTETDRPKQIVSNQKAVDCSCSTENKSSTATKELPSKKPASKCFCKDEPSSKKEKPLSNQTLPEKKPVDCGCMTKIQTTTGKGPAIDIALNCPCKYERSVGTETDRPKQMTVSNQKAVDCSCSTENKSSTVAKELPSKQPLSKCACKDEPSTKKGKSGPEQSLPVISVDCECTTKTQPNSGQSPDKKPSTALKVQPSKCACKDPSTKKEKPGIEQSLPDKVPVNCGCMTENQPNTGKGPAKQTALNGPCKCERSVSTEKTKQIIPNQKAVDCSCSTENKSSTAAKKLPSKTPVPKCSCKDFLPDKKPVDCGCMTENQPNTGKGPAKQTALNGPCKCKRSVGTEKTKQIIPNQKAVDCSCSTENKSSTAAKKLPSKTPVPKCSCKDFLPDKKPVDCGCMTENQPSTSKGPAKQTALNSLCKCERSVGTEKIRPKQIISNQKAVDCSCSTENKSSTAAKKLPSKQPVSKCACKDEPSTKKGKPGPEQSLPATPVDCECMTKTQSKSGKSHVNKPSTAPKVQPSKQPVSKCSCKDEPSTKKEKPRPEQSSPVKIPVDCGCMTKTQPNTSKGPAKQTALKCPRKYERSVGAETNRPKQNVPDQKAVDCQCSAENKHSTPAKADPSKLPVSECTCKDEIGTKKENPHPEQSLPDKKAIDCGCNTKTQLGAVKSPEKQPIPTAKEQTTKKAVSKCACNDELSTKKGKPQPDPSLPDEIPIDCGCMTKSLSNTGKGAMQTAFNCPCNNELSVGTETIRPKQIVLNKKGVECRSEKTPSTAAKEHVQSIVTDSETNTSGYKLVQTTSLEQLSLKVNVSEDRSLKCKIPVCPCKDKYRPSVITSEITIPSESLKKLSQKKCSSTQIPLKKKLTTLLRRSVMTPKVSKCNQYGESTNYLEVGHQKPFKTTTVDCGYGPDNEPNTTMIAHPIQYQSHAIQVGEKQILVPQGTPKCSCTNVKIAGKCGPWPKNLPTATTADKINLLDKLRNELTISLSSQRVTNNDKQQQTSNSLQFGLALNCLCGNDRDIPSNQTTVRPSSESDDTAAQMQSQIATDNDNVKLKSTFTDPTDYSDKLPNQILKPISSQPVISNNKQQQTSSSQQTNDSQFGVALNCSCGNEGDIVSIQKTDRRQPLNQSQGISDAVIKMQPQIAADNNNINLKTSPTLATTDQTGSTNKQPSKLLKPISSQSVINNDKQQQTQPSYVLPQQPSSQSYGIAPDCVCQTQPLTAVDNNTKPKMPLSVTTAQKTSSIDKPQSEIIQPLSSRQITTDSKQQQRQPPTYGLPKQTLSQQDSQFGVPLNCPCGNDLEIHKTQKTGARKSSGKSQGSECACKIKPQIAVGDKDANIRKTDLEKKLPNQEPKPLKNMPHSTPQKYSKASEFAGEIKSPTLAEHKKTNTSKTGSEEKYLSKQPKAPKTKSHTPQKQSHECACEIKPQLAKDDGTYNHQTGLVEKPPSQQTEFPQLKSRMSKKQSKSIGKLSDCACGTNQPILNNQKRMYADKSSLAEYTPTKQVKFTPNRQPDFGMAIDCPCENAADKIKYPKTQHPSSQQIKSSQKRSSNIISQDSSSKTTQNGIYPNRHTQTQPSMIGISSDCVCETFEPIETDNKNLRSRTAGLEHLPRAPIHPLSQHKRATQTESPILQELSDYNNRNRTCETSLDQQNKLVQSNTKCTCKDKSSIAWCKKRALKCNCRTKNEIPREIEAKDEDGKNEAHQPRLVDKATSKGDMTKKERETNIEKQSSSLKTKSNQRSTLTETLSECACEFQNKPTPKFKKGNKSRNSAIVVKSKSRSPRRSKSSRRSSLVSFTHTECVCLPKKLNASQSSNRSWKPTRSDKSHSRLFMSKPNKNKRSQVFRSNESAYPSHEKLRKISSESENLDKKVPRGAKSLKQSSKRSCNSTECSCLPSSQLPPSKSTRHTNKFSRLIMKLRSKFCSHKKNQQTQIKLPNNEPVLACACPVSINTTSQLKFKHVGKPRRSFLQRFGASSQKSKTSQTKSSRSFLGHIECIRNIDKMSSAKSLSKDKLLRSRSRYSQSSKRSSAPITSPRTSRSMTQSECRCTHSQFTRFTRKPLRVDKSHLKSSRSSSFLSCPRNESGSRVKNSSHPKLFEGNKKQQPKISPIEFVCSSGETPSKRNGEECNSLKIPKQSILTPQYVPSQQHKISQFPSQMRRSQENRSARKLNNNLQQTISDSQYISGQQTIITQFPSPLHNTPLMSTTSTKNSKLLSGYSPQRHSGHTLYRNEHEKISRSLNVQTAPIIPGKCACLSENLRQLSEKISQYSHSNGSQPIASVEKQQFNSNTVAQDPRKTKITTERPRAYPGHVSREQFSKTKERVPAEQVALSQPTPTLGTEKPPELSQQLPMPKSDLPKQDLLYKYPQSKQIVSENLGNDITSQKPSKTQLEKNLQQNPSQRYPNQHVMRPYPYDPSCPIVPTIPGMCTCAVKQRLSEYLRKMSEANKPKQNYIQPEISDSSPGLHIIPAPQNDKKLSHQYKPSPDSNVQPSHFAEERRLQSDAVSNIPHKTTVETKKSPLPQSHTQQHEISKRLSDTVSQKSQKPMLETDVQELNRSRIHSQPKPSPENQQLPSKNISHSFHKIPSHTRAIQQPEISKYSRNLDSPRIPLVEKERLQQANPVQELSQKTDKGTGGQPELLNNLPNQQPESSPPFHDFHPTRIIPGKCTCSENIYNNSHHIKRDLSERKLQPEPLHHPSINHPPQNSQQAFSTEFLRVYTNSANKVPRIRTNANNYSNIKGQTDKLLDLSRHVIVQRSKILQSPQNLQTNLPLKQVFSVLKRNACECPTEESNISPEETAPVDKRLLQRRSSGKGEAASGQKQRSKPVKPQPCPDFNRVTMRYPARKRSEQSPGPKKTEHIPPPAKYNYQPAVGVSCPPNFSRRPCYANPANKCGPKTCFDETALRRAYKRRPLRYTPPKQQPKSKKGLKQKKQRKKDKKKIQKQKEKQKRKKVMNVKSRLGFNIFTCCQCVQELVNEAEKDAWPNDVTCRPIYIHALKRKPCFWIFKLFPSIYPAFLSCLKLQQNVCQMCLYIFALCLWSPFLLCFYVCFNLICKI